MSSEPAPPGALQSRLRADLTTAIKARDELRTATLRMVLAAIRTEEVSGNEARELSDDEVLRVLRREGKKRREAAAAFESGGRTASAERERAEGGVIDTYLPRQLGDDELAVLVSAVIEETGAAGPQAIGPVMKVVATRVAGRADGGRAAAEVKRQLAR